MANLGLKYSLSSFYPIIKSKFENPVPFFIKFGLVRGLLYILLVFSIYSNAQTPRDSAFKKNNTEIPLGFVKHSNFTTLITNSNLFNSGYADAGSIIVTGLNFDNSIKFSKSIETGTVGITKLRYDKILSCSSTENKGVLFVLKGRLCSSPSQNKYDVTYLVKVDSIGQVIFSLATTSLSSVGIVAPNFYFVTDNVVIKRINPNNAATTNTIYLPSGTITATSVNEKKHIVFSTNNNLSVIDTSGNLITSLNGTFNYSRIKSYKKNYYLLNNNKNILELKDSALTTITSFTANINSVINDFSIYEDSIFISSHDTLTDLSTISAYTSQFNFIGDKLIQNAKHEVIQIEKDGLINLLAQEKLGNSKNNSLAGGVWFAINNTSYSSFSKMSEINYTADIAIKRIKRLQFSMTVSKQPLGYVCSYNYLNSIILYNNSIETIENFNISHQMQEIIFGSSQYCNSGSSFKAYDNTYTLTINPLDSVEVQLPNLFGAFFIGQTSTVTIPIQFCYAVTLPNNKTDNNLTNSLLCTNFTTVVPVESNVVTITNKTDLPLVYPTITKGELNIFSDSTFNSYTITDVSGKILRIGADTRKIYVSDFSSGLYFIIFEYGKDKIVDRRIRKFIKEEQ